MKHSLNHSTIRTTLLALLTVLTPAYAEENPAPADPILKAEATFKQSATPVQIPPLLFGSHFTFFNLAISERIENEALLKTWKEMPVRILRYPGGTWADHYLWDNPAGSHWAGGDAKHYVTPKQFIKACGAIGAEAIFQVNTLTISPGNKINPTKLADMQEGAAKAAGWVREANIKNGWKVKYWEIGNETWIWNHPEEYARLVVEYSKAMKKVDPSIKIIACGLSHTTRVFNPSSWLNFPNDPNWKPRTAIQNNVENWNKALFTIAKGSFDYYAPHIYLSALYYDAKRPAHELAQEVLKNPTPYYLGSVAAVMECKELKEQQELSAKYNSPARLAITEWDTNCNLSVPNRAGVDLLPKLYFYTLGNGLNNALLFGRILEGAAATEIAILHEMADIQTLYYWPRKQMATSTPILSPTYLAMSIWGSHTGKQALDLSIDQIPQLKINEKEYPAVFLFGSEDDRVVHVVAINLDPSADHKIVVTLKDFKALDSTATATWMKGAEIDSNNFSSFNDENPQEVALTTSSITGSDGKWILKMPAHSMVGLTILKK